VPFAELVDAWNGWRRSSAPRARRPGTGPRPAVARHRPSSPPGRRPRGRAPVLRPRAFHPCPGAGRPCRCAAGILAAMIGLAATRAVAGQPLRGAQARLDGETLMLDVAPDFSTFASMHAEDYRELARKRPAGR